jgi:hypothetical protein|tara:strand:- start:306 stop:554 length:249 start_codon:yes stop_codon:yes gene_type:complete
MATRNFHLTARADGNRTDATCSPRSKDGGMDITLRVRNHGEIVDAVDILCRERDGKLIIKIQPNQAIITETGEREIVMESDR